MLRGRASVNVESLSSSELTVGEGPGTVAVWESSTTSSRPVRGCSATIGSNIRWMLGTALTEQGESYASASLGKSGLEVSAMRLGCMGMSFDYGTPPDREEMIKLIRGAVDRGVALFDTAEAHGPVTNEELVGEALASVRSQVVIAPKFGIKLGTSDMDSRPAHIREVAEASLKRLKRELIDLFYQHRVDPNVPIEDVAGTVRDPIRKGKVKHFGMSEPGVATVGLAHAVQQVAAFKASTRFGGASAKRISCRRSKSSASASCRSAALGKGFLTGKIDEKSTFEKNTSATSCRASRRRRARPPSRSSTCSVRSRSGRTQWRRRRGTGCTQKAGSTASSSESASCHHRETQPRQSSVESE
jgi:aryl-alcohol dehydrogenase-like predicted oxidoreductase